MLLIDAVAPKNEVRSGVGCSQAARNSALPHFIREWVGRSPDRDPQPASGGGPAPGAQTWGEAARVLNEAGCCFTRNAWGAVSVSSGGVELDYRKLPQGPIKQAWNTLSVDEPDPDLELPQGPAQADGS
jgi:hypothetical protein